MLLLFLCFVFPSQLANLTCSTWISFNHSALNFRNALSFKCSPLSRPAYLRTPTRFLLSTIVIFFLIFRLHSSFAILDVTCFSAMIFLSNLICFLFLIPLLGLPGNLLQPHLYCINQLPSLLHKRRALRTFSNI